jgi:hypothetical protein
MPTFNKHGEIDDQSNEFQQQLYEKEVGTATIPEKQVARPAPTYRSPQRMLPPVVWFVAGTGLLLLFIAVGIGIGLFIGNQNRTVAAVLTPTVIVPTLAPPSVTSATAPASVVDTTPVVPTLTVTPTPEEQVTPTTEPQEGLAINYTDGLSAYNAQDWETAAEQFSNVYNEDQTYLDTADKLSATYYNWSVELLTIPEPANALDKLNAALSISPTHQLALIQQQKLLGYLDALDLRDKGELRNAAIKLEELRAIQADFLDSTAILYDIYLRYGAELEQQNKLQDALRIYSKAAKLPLENTSTAKEKVASITARLRPPDPPTAVARPTESARLRFRVLNYNDTPSCISINISGIRPAGWYFSVDGVRGVIGRFDGGGNARACGLNAGQEVTITVFDGNGRVVPGGSGVPSKGSAIMSASWR